MESLLINLTKTVHELPNLYNYDINKSWFFDIILNLHYYFNLNNENSAYELNNKNLPTSGSEQNLSISINYKI